MKEIQRVDHESLVSVEELDSKDLDSLRRCLMFFKLCFVSV